MPRLVNEEISRLLSDIKTSEINASEAFYNQFKAMTKIVGTDSFKGAGADAYKNYVADVDINYLNSFLNLTKEVTATIKKIKETFTAFESSDSGIVGSGTLGDVKKELNNKKNDFTNLVTEIEAVNSQASDYISVKKLSSSSVQSDFDSSIKLAETIKDDLSNANSTALSNAESLYQRIQELKSCVSKISSEYHSNGKINYAKAKDISKEKWYTVEAPVALKQVAMNDPYGYEVFGDSGIRSQWARGLNNDVYGMLFGGASEWAARNEKGKFYRGTEFSYSGLNAGAYGQFTEYFKLNGKISAIEANAKYRMGANKDYLGTALEGNFHVAKVDSSAVLGTDSLNAYVKGNAELLSASGHVNFEFEQDSFNIGLGGKASAADASFTVGLSFLEYDNGASEKGNLFGISASPKLDAGFSAEASLSGQKATSIGPVDINAISINLGGSLALGLDVSLTVPWPTLNLNWGL